MTQLVITNLLQNVWTTDSLGGLFFFQGYQTVFVYQSTKWHINLSLLFFLPSDFLLYENLVNKFPAFLVMTQLYWSDLILEYMDLK